MASICSVCGGWGLRSDCTHVQSLYESGKHDCLKHLIDLDVDFQRRYRKESNAHNFDNNRPSSLDQKDFDYEYWCEKQRLQHFLNEKRQQYAREFKTWRVLVSGGAIQNFGYANENTALEHQGHRSSWHSSASQETLIFHSRSQHESVGNGLIQALIHVGRTCATQLRSWAYHQVGQVVSVNVGSNCGVEYWVGIECPRLSSV